MLLEETKLLDNNQPPTKYNETQSDAESATPLCNSAANSRVHGSPIDIIAMGVEDEKCNFKPMRLQRRPLGASDILFDLKYSGVCGSDLHFAENHMKATPAKTVYPLVPGHELAGVVTAVGKDVTKFRVGDHIGVGCIVSSCLQCSKCKGRDEHRCAKNMVSTYGSPDPFGFAAVYPEGSRTVGGYSNRMVVHERFAIKVPKEYPLECAGPIMCAGITMYDPLRALKAKAGTSVGIAGLGGLGMLGIKIAKAMGCKVTAISRSRRKEALARKAGADVFIPMAEPAEAAKWAGSLDIIIDTIPSGHGLGPYKSLLTKKSTSERGQGRIVLLGMPEAWIAWFILGNPDQAEASSAVVSSLIGSIEATQEIMDLCAKNDIKPEIEIRSVLDLNKIYESLSGQNATGKRFVLDIGKTLNEETFKKHAAAPPSPPKLEPHEAVGMCGIVRAICRFTRCCCCCWY